MNLLDFYIPEWSFVALNLLILIAVLRKIFWKPINKILDERGARAEKAQRDAEETARIRDEMAFVSAELDREMELRAASMVQEARGRAGKEYDRIITEAEKKAESIVSAAHKKALLEQDRALVETRKQVASLAMEAAALLVRENMNSDKNRTLLERFLSEKEASA